VSNKKKKINLNIFLIYIYIYIYIFNTFKKIFYLILKKSSNYDKNKNFLII